MTAMPLHVHPHFNPEEAASAAAEFVSSLDNLPGEVTFLLQEIKEKDDRISQLVSRINQRHYGLTKSVKNLSSAAPATPNPSFPLPIAAGAAIPTAHLSSKDASSIAKIQAEWVKIEALQEEKIKLAERLERIVSRARERGKAEWRKVGGIDIDELDSDVKLGDLGGADVLLPTSGLGSGSDGRRRKNKTPALPTATTSSGSVAASSPAGSMPPPPVPRAGSQGRGSSRASNRAERQQSEPEPEPVETEVEAEVEADDRNYCFCQQKSYGEMVGCDNPQCKYEWFHVKCINIVGELPLKWYCPDCVQRYGLTSSDDKKHKERKGRKK